MVIQVFLPYEWNFDPRSRNRVQVHCISLLSLTIIFSLLEILDIFSKKIGLRLNDRTFVDAVNKSENVGN